MRLPAILQNLLPKTQAQGGVTVPQGGGGGGGFDSAYTAASLSTQEMASWYPSLTSADSAILPRRDLTVARIRDLLRNDAHARAGIDRLCDSVVGKGLWLAAKPDAAALGITPEQARDLGKEMQREWRAFANDPRRFCDAQRRLDMDGLFRLFARTWFSLGEATAVLTQRKDPWSRYSTCVLAVNPDRLSTPGDQPETSRLRAGVSLDAMGAPVGYYVRNAHPADWLSGYETSVWTYVPRATPWGRPIFVHGFEPEGEDQTRGVSPFVALVSKLRMLGKHSDHELASAALNAMFSAQVESDLPAEEVAQRLTPVTNISDRKSHTAWLMDWFQRFPAKIGGVRVPVMPPGTKMTMNNTPRQTTAFNTFQRAFLQSIAAALGISYEQLSMDWSSTNYSSARAALNEVWRTMKRMTSAFVEQMVTPIYFAVMDEAFDRGYVKEPKGAPSFIDAPGAYLNCRWGSPGRGFIDPVKEAEAAGLRMESLTSTLEDELADQGRPLEETLDQIAFENAELKRRGLSRMSIVASIQAANRLKPDSPEAQQPVAQEAMKEAA